MVLCARHELLKDLVTSIDFVTAARLNCLMKKVIVMNSILINPNSANMWK